MRGPGTSAVGGVEEKHREDSDEGFERMAKSRLDGDEVVEEREQDEGPDEEPGSGMAAMKGECEAEESGEREKGVVQAAQSFGDLCGGLFRGVRDGDPEEEDSLDGVGGKEPGMRADKGACAEALFAGVGELAESAVALELRGGFGERERGDVGESLVERVG